MSSPVTGCHCSTHAVRDEVVHDKLVNLAFICNGRLEQVRVRGGHGWEKDSLQRGISVSEEVEIARRKEKNGSGVING
jgi:hypothetical protein